MPIRDKQIGQSMRNSKMDKYQKFLIANLRFNLGEYISNEKVPFETKEEFDDYKKSSSYSSVSAFYIDNYESSLTLDQGEDYHKTKFLLFASSQTISSMMLIEGTTQEKAKIILYPKGYALFSLPIDFLSPKETLRIEFNNNVANPLNVTIKYKFADKKAWDDKAEKEDRDQLIKAMNISLRTGVDLINVFFQPCNDKVKETDVELYSASSDREPINYQKLGLFKVDQGMNMKSITGLAFGLYALKVIQKDSQGNVVIASDFIDFKISKPNYGGLGLIRG